MASNSAASRRPLPQITERATPTGSLVDGKDSGGRRHMSSSVTRTAFPPGPEKAAMKKLKQRMTFSDHSAGSSTKSTPTKVIRKPAALLFTDPRPSSGGKKSRKNAREAATDPAKFRYKSHTIPSSTSASFVPISYLNEDAASKDESTSDIFSDLYASEGELPITLTVSTLLSKLDSVKNFLKEAEAMREKFVDKKDEPGMMTQLNKLDKLIDQLQQQESGYLGELIRLTELDESRLNESTGDDLDYSEDEDDEEEEGSEEDSSDGEDQTTVLAASGGSRDRLSQTREKSSVSREGSSLSLRQAQMEMEEQAKEELLALQQQKEMLTNLLEKQKQIQELEAKQKALLEMKAKAEEQLKEAEAKGLEIQKLADAAEAQTGQPKPDERELLLSKLGELRARKERVDQLTDLMQELRTGEERGVGGMVEREEGGEVPEAKPTNSLAQSIPVAQSVQSTGGLSEMVAERKDPRSSSPNLEELHAKLREAAEARRQLVEARKRYDLQTQVAAGNFLGSVESGDGKEETKGTWRTTWSPQQQQQGGRKAVKDSTSKIKKDSGILESLLSDVTGEGVTALERSLVSDYEGKLSKKKEEVAELLKEREELRATQKRLLALQKKMHFRQYLDESSRQNGDQEVVSQTDVTGATWGGSTVQSDPEDTASSVSLPSDIVADITQESNAEPLDHGEGATVEQVGRGKTPPFSVTRHTPRTRPNVRLRTHSQDSTEATLRADKKLKMEATEDTVKSKRKPETGKNPLASSFKASFKSPPKTATGETGGIFGGSGEFTGLAGLGGTNTMDGVGGASFSVGGATFTGGNLDPQSSLQQQNLAYENTALLHNQLAFTSHMCSQLLYGQNNLIRAVCGHLDRSQGNPQMAEQVAALQQYEMELEAYYHQLCESYARIQQHQESREGVNESEEPVVSNTGNATNGEGPSAVPQATVGAQQDPAAEQFPQSFIPPPLSHYYPSPLYQQPLARPPTNEGRPATPVPMAYLPPPPPPLGNPYASPGFWHSQTGQQLYQSPFYSSQQQQTPNLAAVEASPFRHQHERSSSMSQQMQMPVPGAGYVPPFQPAGVYPYQMPPFATQGNLGGTLGASVEGGQGPSFYRPLPAHLGMQVPPTHQHTGNKDGGLAGLLSPSGVTASSMQVNAPTSPPSAPSVNNQPIPGAATGDSNSAEPTNSNNNNTSSVLPSQPVGGGTLVAASGESQQGAVGGEAAAAAAAATGNGTALKSARAAAQKESVATVKGTQSHDGDQDSLSSLPMSLDNPLGASGGQNEGAPAGFSVFDSLRDTIYSEVATLIANNENRPHFLVELFRELQMLSTDYLRQRALYNLQELVTRYLTEEAIASDALTSQDKQYEAWLGLGGANESEEGEEGSVVRSKPRPHEGKEFDYAEAVNSASSVSTPPNDPFASDELGETVIKVDGAVTHMYSTREEADSFTVPILGPVKTDGAMPLAATGLGYPDIDTQVLDEQIKGIMMDVIPVLKENLDRECDTELIILLAKRIVNVVVEQEKSQKHDYFGAFQKQLDVTVKTVMEKYRGRKFRECGEDLLMDVSEVLFNELAFFKLMEDFKGHPQLNGDFRSVTSSQTTTEPEDSSFAEGEGEGLGGGDSGQPAHPNVASQGAEGSDYPKPLDPALLQVLSFAANLTLQEEEDTLGKTRDDTLATSWDPKLQQSSPSGDEQDQPSEPSVKVVELSVSESQPIQKVGSDEEEEVEVTEDTETLMHPPPPASEETTPTPTGPGTSHVEANGTAAATEDSEGGGVVTPPTPIALMVTPAGATEPVPFESIEPLPSTPPPENGNGEGTASPSQDGSATIEKAAAINKEEGKTVEQPFQATSPPVITTMTEADLEARMKAEQRGMEGIDGILSSMTEGQPHELGLVGDENEMDTPVNSNGI